MEEEDQQQGQEAPKTTAFYAEKPPASILHRALLLAVFLFLIPFFPSEAPEFLHYTPITGSWELVHLLLVGLAVSYGLCSRRNTDECPNPDGESTNKPHFELRVASVFDEEDEQEQFVGANNTQMWSSKYQRGEPNLVLAGSSRSKTLCFPVRSLRSQLPEVEKKQVGEDTNEIARPSPIPWRARPGTRVENPASSAAPNPPSPLLDRPPSFESRTATRKASPSPPASASHSPSQSLDLRGRSYEEVTSVRRNSHKSSFSPVPPPPPPPPPRPFTASRRSLHPSERFQRNRFPSDPLEESNKSGGREPTDGIPSNFLPKQEQSTPPKPVSGPVIKEEATCNRRKKIKTRKGWSRKFIIDSDDEGSGSEGPSGEEESSSDASSAVTEAEPDGNEVDKKADEFIAKFREQIRLQRIESIKRSAALRRRAK